MFPLNTKWYGKIKSGEKTCEIRAASKHWLTRIKGASEAVLTLGHLIIDITSNSFVGG